MTETTLDFNEWTTLAGSPLVKINFYKYMYRSKFTYIQALAKNWTFLVSMMCLCSISSALYDSAYIPNLELHANAWHGKIKQWPVL